MSSLRRGHANLLCIVPIFADDLVRGSVQAPLWTLTGALRSVSLRLWLQCSAACWNKTLGAVRELNPRPLAPKARIIPLDQQPTGPQKHARRDSNPQPPDSKSDALSIAPRAPQTSVRGAPLGFCPLNGGQKSAQNNRQQRDSNSRGISSK